ncbi:hypothetical protein LTR62_008363 [Meristemomyces frigidus]|uniref:Uncharacterized protein n=1 Tax=Meristemomyces frigidus TaxID=1508187 RepID=A0AAN7T9S2_9PEZI|nr:hypothetical protein LTR62_008363 [Meristemomyces frigidus]
MYFDARTLCLLLPLLPRIVAQSPAQAVSGNPGGVSYIATLPQPAGENLPRGNLVVSSAPNGNGVSIQASISNLAVAGAGNALNPTNISTTTLCDPKNATYCQVGDLSGKDGAMASGASFSASYTDLYISTQPNTPAFVGNRSLVIFFANMTSLTCANFTTPGSGGSSAGSLSWSVGSGLPAASSTASPVASSSLVGSSGASTASVSVYANAGPGSPESSTSVPGGSGSSVSGGTGSGGSSGSSGPGSSGSGSSGSGAGTTGAGSATANGVGPGTGSGGAGSIEPKDWGSASLPIAAPANEGPIPAPGSTITQTTTAYTALTVFTDKSQSSATPLPPKDSEKPDKTTIEKTTTV